MVLSVVSFFWIIQWKKRLKGWLYAILFLVFGLIAVISMAIVLFYFIAPSNVVQ
jgi:hypothetical protein